MSSTTLTGECFHAIRAKNCECGITPSCAFERQHSDVKQLPTRIVKRMQTGRKFEKLEDREHAESARALSKAKQSYGILHALIQSNGQGLTCGSSQVRRNDLGTAQNLLYHLAGGEEKLLQKNLLAPYEIIAKNTTAQSPFP